MKVMVVGNQTKRTGGVTYDFSPSLTEPPMDEGRRGPETFSDVVHCITVNKDGTVSKRTAAEVDNKSAGEAMTHVIRSLFVHFPDIVLSVLLAVCAGEITFERGTQNES